MSLIRFALRQAALAAVCPPFAPGDPEPTTHPTLAERRWYDSFMSSFDDLAQDQQRPIGVIGTTDSAVGERGDHDGVNQGGFANTVLVFNIGLAALKAFDDGENGPVFLPSSPVTDAELEASLDLFEHQVRAAVLRSPLVKLCSPWGVREIRSMVDRDETGARLAARRIEMEVSLYDELDESEWGEVPRVLRDLLAKLPAGSRQHDLVQVMADLAATPTTSSTDAMLTIRLGLDLTRNPDVETESLRADVVTTDPIAPVEDLDQETEDGDETDPRNIYPYTPPRT